MQLAATSATLSIQDLTQFVEDRDRPAPGRGRRRRRRPGLRRSQPAGADHPRPGRAGRPRPDRRRPHDRARQRHLRRAGRQHFRLLHRRCSCAPTPAAKSAEEIGNIQINPTTKVSDVADVIFGPADKTTSLRINGKTGLGLGIVRQARANTLDISAGVKTAIAELKTVAARRASNIDDHLRRRRIHRRRDPRGADHAAARHRHRHRRSSTCSCARCA